MTIGFSFDPEPEPEPEGFENGSLSISLSILPSAIRDMVRNSLKYKYDQQARQSREVLEPKLLSFRSQDVGYTQKLPDHCC
jgi:hypothetical protein